MAWPMPDPAARDCRDASLEEARSSPFPPCVRRLPREPRRSPQSAGPGQLAEMMVGVTEGMSIMVRRLK